MAVEPPILVQYATHVDASGTTHDTSITYVDGDTVLVLAVNGGGIITTTTDSGGSDFASKVVGLAGYWQIACCLSAKASTSVRVTTSGSASVTIIVAVFRGVSAIGSDTGRVNGSGTTISPGALSVSAGSKIVGALGVAFNAGGTVTVSGDASGLTTHGDLRTQVGNGNTTSLMSLIDADASISSGSSITLQETASRTGNWESLAVELKGKTPSYYISDSIYVIGDIVDSDGIIHNSVQFNSSGMNLIAQKGSFPCIPQNGGASVVQTYAFGHISTRLSFTFGTVEAKIKFPASVGPHPALWMKSVQSKPWPNAASGPAVGATGYEEIDIAELTNNVATTLYNNVYNPSLTQNSTTVADPSLAFHVYKLTWTNTTLTWYIDGTQKNQVSTAVTGPMYVLIGGYMGEYAITDAGLPTSMTVQYLKITDNSSNVLLNTDFTKISAGNTSAQQLRRRRDF